MKKKIKAFFVSFLSVYVGFVILMFVVSLFAQCAGAGSIYGRYGVGVFHSAEDSFAETKTLGFGYQKDLFLPMFVQQYEAGFWTDRRLDLSRRGSGYLSGSAGLSVDGGSNFIQALWGVSVLTGHDSMLGGVFPQFRQDLVIGMKDKIGCSIGLVYTHFSSAGLVEPNQGRDLISIRLMLPVF